MLQAVLFDFGDTLIYFDADWQTVEQQAVETLVDALGRNGRPVDPQEFPRAYNRSLEEYNRQRDTEFIEYTRGRIIQEMLQGHGLAPLEDGVLRCILREVYAAAQQHWCLEDDALPLLEYLQRTGLRLGLVSNTGDDEHVQTLVDRLGLRRFFPAVRTSAASGLRKPHPRIFLDALAALQTAPQQAVMVGDMLGADILGAHNAGLQAIWIIRRSAERAANASHDGTIQPDAVIGCLAELPCALAALEKMHRPTRQ